MFMTVSYKSRAALGSPASIIIPEKSFLLTGKSFLQIQFLLLIFVCVIE